jgi:IS1 family transposase
MCKECGTAYTNNPKQREYSEETKVMAIKMYYSEVSGRGVGRVLGMNKSNVYNWIKKTKPSVHNSYETLEIDELYWFVFHKPRTKARENVYLIIMVNRAPRQIVGYEVAYDKSLQKIQDMIDSAPPASRYCTDGFLGYVDVVYPGNHVRNIRDKSDTFTVESVNADLRHYIPLLARRSRCFARTLETLKAVVEVFVDAYNRFSEAKHKFRLNRKCRDFPFGYVDFL